MSGYILETQSLTKKFGKQTVVNSIDIHVPKGKIYGLLGRNGAGKTTAMGMIMNLIHPTSGEIKIFGKEHNKNIKDIYSHIGCMIETPGFYQNLSAIENLRVLARLRGLHNKDAIGYALSRVGLENEGRKKVSDYSLGMKQRLGIAAAIMHEPKLLILDEPTNGLDPVGIHEVRKFLTSLCEDKQITILISSHILGEIEQIADTIGIIHEGNLLEEIEMNQIKKINRQYLRLTVSSVPGTLHIMKNKLSIKDYEVVDENSIRIFEFNHDVAELNRTLVNSNIGVREIYHCEGSLEDYFIKLTGGVGIA